MTTLDHPYWTSVRALYWRANHRMTRRARALIVARAAACSHWRTCRHSGCALTRRADTLLHEAAALVNYLHRIDG